MEPVQPIAALQDNYIWMLSRGSHAVVVDPGDAGPVIRCLQQERLHLAGILITHHHLDHRGGIPELCARYRPRVYGPHAENIPGITHPLASGDTAQFPELDLTCEVLAVPGHTRGHLAYLGWEHLFCGDTLFSAGCGRIFEGTPAEMKDSLGRLAELPETTEVCCAHEYTEDNLRFALMVEPANPILQKWAEEVTLLRARGRPSLPSTIALEKAMNPFLRSSEPSVVEAVCRRRGSAGDPLSVFTALRKWKDTF